MSARVTWRPNRVLSRRVNQGAAFVGLVVMLLLLGPSVHQVSAATEYDCYSYHCYAEGNKVITASGLEAQWHDLALTMPDSEVQDFGHLTNEMWLNGDNGEWVEMGLSRGCSVNTGGTTCLAAGGSDVYQQFAYEAGPNGYRAFHHIATLSADGNNHAYELWDSSNGANDTYYGYIDDSLVYTATKQTESSGASWSVGMELYSPSADPNSGESSGDRFHNYIQDYRNSDPGWNYVIMDSNTSNTAPCDQSDNCVLNPCGGSGIPEAACLFGARTSDYEWSEYKPG